MQEFICFALAAIMQNYIIFADSARDLATCGQTTRMTEVRESLI